MNRSFALCLVVSSLIPTRRTCAEEQGTIAAARELAKQGFKAYHEHRYQEAADKSLSAYQMVRVPTLAVNRARALAQLGKLAEALAWYREATELRPAQEPWQQVQYETQRIAGTERDALLPRVPRLRVVIAGADPAQVVVRIGDAGGPIALNVDHRLDPGGHTIIGRSGNEEVRTTVSAKEGDALLVTLQFGTTPARAKPRASSLVVYTPPIRHEAAKSSNAQTLLGWSGVALGGVGIAFGSVEGLLARSKRKALVGAGRCSADGSCDPSVSGEVDSLMLRRTLSTVGFATGGALVAAGLTLLLWPAAHDAPPTTIAVGSGFLTVQGGFQ